MKSQSHRNIAVQSTLALALVLALMLFIWSPVRAGPAAAPEDKMTEAQLMQRCNELKEQKQRLTKDSRTQDAELTEQLNQMNRAPADKKLDLMAAVVTKMATQRMAMDVRRGNMEDAMMKHMMLHMQMGKDSMRDCPMMNDMKDMDDDMNRQDGTIAVDPKAHPDERK
jgi:hypothetical protein